MKSGDFLFQFEIREDANNFSFSKTLRVNTVPSAKDPSGTDIAFANTKLLAP